MTGAPSPADFERRTRDLQNLFRLTRVEIPHHHRLTEMFHRLGIGRHLTELRHVIVQSGE